MIEIKVAESWSLNVLEQALEHQLVDQYMSANNSRYGIFVLCSSGPEKGTGWREGPSAPSLDFEALANRLSNRAQAIMARNGHIRGLRVVPIDFY